MGNPQLSPFVPSFDGKASSFLDYEQRVTLWVRSTDVPVERQSALLILHMDPTARQVCMYNAGGDTLMAGCEVQLVLRTLRDYFQPDTFDRIFTQMGRFMSYVRTDQPIEKFLMEFGILRQKAEKLMYPSGGGFEDLFVCFQCIKAARLKPNDKILLMASLGGTVVFARITQQLRQLFNQSNPATKEDISPVTEEPAESRPEDLSYEAWVSYHQKRKQKAVAGTPPRSQTKGGKGKKTKNPKGGSEKNGFNRRTGERNRCFGCGSEYHLLPQCPNKQERKAPVALPPVSPTPRSSFSSITLEDSPQDANVLEHSFTTSLSRNRPIYFFCS